MLITSTSLAETEAAAREFLQTLTSAVPPTTATVVALHGDLGAGKTAFTKIMAHLLGVSVEVTSPTFVIEKVYEIKKTEHFPFVRLIHIDAYRLESFKEITSIRFEEKIADPTNLILIEWPEKIAEVMPAFAHHLYFTFIDEATRTIEIKD